MKLKQVRTNGKLDIVNTIKLNFSPRINKADRLTLSQIIKQQKYADKHARLMRLNLR